MRSGGGGICKNVKTPPCQRDGGMWFTPQGEKKHPAMEWGHDGVDSFGGGRELLYIDMGFLDLVHLQLAVDQHEMDACGSLGAHVQIGHLKPVVFLGHYADDFGHVAGAILKAGAKTPRSIAGTVVALVFVGLLQMLLQ